MDIAELISRLDKAHVSFRLVGNRIRLIGSYENLTDELMAEVESRKGDIASWLIAHSGDAGRLCMFCGNPLFADNSIASGICAVCEAEDAQPGGPVGLASIAPVAMQYTRAEIMAHVVRIRDAINDGNPQPEAFDVLADWEAILAMKTELDDSPVGGIHYQWALPPGERPAEHGMPERIVTWMVVEPVMDDLGILDDILSRVVVLSREARKPAARDIMPVVQAIRRHRQSLIDRMEKGNEWFAAHPLPPVPTPAEMEADAEATFAWMALLRLYERTELALRDVFSLIPDLMENPQ